MQPHKGLQNENPLRINEVGGGVGRVELPTNGLGIEASLPGSLVFSRLGFPQAAPIVQFGHVWAGTVQRIVQEPNRA